MESAPTKLEASPKVRACVSCHFAKRKCTYSFSNQTKCDRCLKKDVECVPHVSRQGKRPGEKSGDKDAKVSASGETQAKGKKGGSKGISANQVVWGVKNEDISKGVPAKMQGGAAICLPASALKNIPTKPEPQAYFKSIDNFSHSKNAPNTSAAPLKYQTDQPWGMPVLGVNQDANSQASVINSDATKTGNILSLDAIPSTQNFNHTYPSYEVNNTSLNGATALPAVKKTAAAALNSVGLKSASRQTSNIQHGVTNKIINYDSQPLLDTNTNLYVNDSRCAVSNKSLNGDTVAALPANASAASVSTSVGLKSVSRQAAQPLLNTQNDLYLNNVRFESSDKSLNGSTASTALPICTTAAALNFQKSHRKYSGSKMNDMLLSDYAIGEGSTFADDSVRVNQLPMIGSPVKPTPPFFEAFTCPAVAATVSTSTNQTSAQKQSENLHTDASKMEGQTQPMFDTQTGLHFNDPRSDVCAAIVPPVAAVAAPSNAGQTSPSSPFFESGNNECKVNQSPIFASISLDFPSRHLNSKAVNQTFLDRSASIGADSLSLPVSSYCINSSGEGKVEMDQVSLSVTPQCKIPVPYEKFEKFKPSLSTVSLKQWTKGALDSISQDDIASTSYLTAALQIAISLTKQIMSIENTDPHKLVNMLNAGCHWGDWVRIKLKVNSDENPHDLGEEFNESCQEVSCKAFNNSSSNSRDLNYHHIVAAEIQCIRDEQGETRISSKRESDSMKTIYFLGLVLYELFGGEVLPLGLSSLASVDGAFISLPRLSLSDSHEDNEFIRDAKRQQGPASAGTVEEMGLCDLSCEHLRFKGVPGPLCNLIFNMLDCVYGDFGGKECYTQMEDIVSDLQLMMDRPSRFLRDLDMDALSLSGLQAEAIDIPRETEFDSIKSCYQRCVLGSELAIITGESGSGKTRLAKHVGRYIMAKGGIFLSTKFDQMRQAIPFVSLASAFDQYCKILIRMKESDWSKGVIDQLRAALGRDAYHLIKVIPKLGQVLDEYTPHIDTDVDQNSRNAIQRLCYLLSQFVNVISTASDVPITLFVDDVQWADEASILVLYEILRRENKSFFFLACCRENEQVGNDNPFWKMICNSSQVVHLKCIGKDDLNKVMSDIMCLSPRLVKSLSYLIHSKTRGNPQFFSQLVLSLQHGGLIHLDFCRKRWVWDEEKILTMKLPDDVAQSFTDDICKLRFEVQSALFSLSMFGASASFKCLEFLESQLNVNLMEPLREAADKGFVNIFEDSFHFSHDRIQEVSYGLLEEKDRLCNHLTFGQCLIKLFEDTNNDAVQFVAINQINLGGPSPAEDAECFTFASLNLNAGKKAMALSQHAAAYSLFSHGIAFLRENHWCSHYHLSLELFELAGKCALATGNIQDIHTLSDEVLRYARSFEDKLNTHFLIMSALAFSSKIEDALERGFSVLSQLGEDIPSNPSQQDLDDHIQQTVSSIQGISKEELVNHRIVSDTTKSAAMKFLGRLRFITMFVKPKHSLFIILKLVQMSISYGLAPASSIAFAYFGLLLATRGNAQLGCHFAIVAKAMLDKLEGATEFAGEIFLVAAEVQFYVEPLLATTELRVLGERASISAGDVHFACLNRYRYVSALLWGGVNLLTVQDKISDACKFMKEQEHRVSLGFTLLMAEVVSTLLVSDAETSERDNLIIAIEEDNIPVETMALSFDNLYLAVVMNKSDLKYFLEKFFEQESMRSRLLFETNVIHSFIAGIAVFRVYRQTRDSYWYDKGRTYKDEIHFLAQTGCAWNFEQKQYLLSAEEHYCNGNLELAKEFYRSAITSARLHRYTNEEALACELAAEFYLGTFDRSSSMEHFILAHDSYLRWGATRKANLLSRYVRENFVDLLDN